ncbi:MAG: ABC transporter permease subunit, partial [Pseudomonadota bacterium]|nr:ABC transporter permease subunit [Pseudomonadota bacterium]
GLSFPETLIYVVIPQAVRMTIPPLTNRTIAITKNTALASVVAVQEMLTVAQTSLAYAANTSPLTLAAIGYLLVFFPLVVLSRWVETRFAWKR